MMASDEMASEPTRGMGEPEIDRSEIDYESLEAKVVAVALVLGSPDFMKR